MRKLVVFMLALILSSCTKDNLYNNKYVLPDITTEGKNTFGCMVDEEVFIPKQNLVGPPALLCSYSRAYDDNGYILPGYYQFKIYATDSRKDHTVSIELLNSKSPLIEGQSYPITLRSSDKFDGKFEYSTVTSDPNYPNSNDPEISGIYYHESHSFETSNEYGGEIHILKLDEEEKILSATFEFDCQDTVHNAIKHVKSGRFDVKYKPFD